MAQAEQPEGARPASSEDLPRLDALLSEALRAIASARGGPELLEDEHSALSGAGTLGRLLEGQDSFLAGGWYEDALVGIAVAHLARFGKGACRGVLDLVYVEPEAREMGVGESLLRAVIEWCTEHGCEALDAPTLPGDRKTKSLLERHAFRARKIVMTGSLSPLPCSA
jgi:GNAT superfamily N-acetyltransferase